MTRPLPTPAYPGTFPPSLAASRSVAVSVGLSVIGISGRSLPIGLALGLLFFSLSGCEQAGEPVATPKLAAAAKPQASAADKALVRQPVWQPVSEERLKGGWVALSDGKTLYAWQAFPQYEPEPPGDAGWSVREGAIVASEGAAAKLVPSVAYLGGFGDCDLRFEATPGNGVAGFGIFVPGSIGVGLASTPGVSSATGGEWHPWDISIRENVVNKKVTIGAAVIGGPGHFGPTEEVPAKRHRVGFDLIANDPAQFRNVIVKPVGLEPLFDGRTLDGWRVVPGSKATFTVDDGTIHVSGGPGFLETTDTYGDFVLQFEAKLNTADVNSGLFFRAEPGTETAPSNGYELQLQNTITNGDRTKPADYGTGFGTGAIFRRQAARYVNASDGEWFHVTLVAVGNRMATWVNGLQVTDFTDERSTDNNPRQGRRDFAGHLSLQGHDGATDASFRNIRVVRLKESG